MTLVNSRSFGSLSFQNDNTSDTGKQINKKFQTLRKCVIVFFGELIGTAILVYCGCLCATKYENENIPLAGALGFGFSLTIAITIFSCTTGGHVNPVVTLSAAIYGLIPYWMIIIYIPAQIIGSLAGFGLLVASMPAQDYYNKLDDPTGICLTLPAPGMSNLNSLISEIFLTMVMTMVCCSLWDSSNAQNQDSASIKMGITVAVLIVDGRNLSGASMNPARSLGPAIWHGRYEYQWIYWVGPIISSIITTSVYKVIFRTDPSRE